MKTTQNKLDKFKQRAIAVHENKYDYSLWTAYGGTSKDYHANNIPIICPEHGKFTNSLANHLRGSGCPKCGRERARNNTRKGRDVIISECMSVHGDMYDYSLIPKEVNKSDRVDIICKKHGKFKQYLGDHISKKSNCPTCVREARLTKSRDLQQIDYSKLNNPEWLYEQHITNGNTLSEISDVLDIDDSTLGEYYKKHNIPVIRHTVSVQEKELYSYIKNELGMSSAQNSNRSIIYPYELDIVIPEKKIAIEYCGLYWHSEAQKPNKKYHSDKMQMCNDAGYRLLTVFEDEWVTFPNIVKSKIKNILNVDTSKSIYARKCVIKKIGSNEKKVFLDRNHIQGSGPSSINIGLYHNNELVACMCFSVGKNEYTLTRYATSRKVNGGFSKLLTHFLRNYEKKKIISFADLRWSNGDVYLNTGWTLDKVIPPDYSYIIEKSKRSHKFNFRHSTLGKKLSNYDPSLSEHKNCLNNSIYRIYDCGKIRFVYDRHME